MDDTKASSELQATDSDRRGERPKTQSPLASDDDFGYCESLFRLSHRQSSESSASDASQAKQLRLYRFLERQRLEFLFDTLLDAGYDDLDQIMFQMRSSLPLDAATLQAIGVKKSSHRVSLLTALEEAAGVKKTYAGSVLCCGPSTRSSDIASTRQWLGEMGLGQLYPLFAEAGFADLEVLRQARNSAYPITDEVLKRRVGIASPQDRELILQRLAQGALGPNATETHILDRESKVSACACTLM